MTFSIISAESLQSTRAARQTRCSFSRRRSSGIRFLGSRKKMLRSHLSPLRWLYMLASHQLAGPLEPCLALSLSVYAIQNEAKELLTSVKGRESSSVHSEKAFPCPEIGGESATRAEAEVPRSHRTCGARFFFTWNRHRVFFKTISRSHCSPRQKLGCLPII